MNQNTKLAKKKKRVIKLPREYVAPCVVRPRVDSTERNPNRTKCSGDGSVYDYIIQRERESNGIQLLKTFNKKKKIKQRQITQDINHEIPKCRMILSNLASILAIRSLSFPPPAGAPYPLALPLLPLLPR